MAGGRVLGPPLMAVPMRVSNFRKAIIYQRLAAASLSALTASTAAHSFFQQFKTEGMPGKSVHTGNPFRGIVTEYVQYHNFNRSHSSIG